MKFIKCAFLIPIISFIVPCTSNDILLENNFRVTNNERLSDKKTYLVLDSYYIMIGLDQTYTIKTSIYPSSIVYFSSDNTDVATVNKDGVIKGIGVGTTKISVTANDKTIFCYVEVSKSSKYVVDLDIGGQRKYTGYVDNNDKPQGEGTTIFKTGDKLTGYYNDGDPVRGKMIYVNGNTYTGEFNRWLRHGYGKLDWSQGSVIGNYFEGYFMNDSCALQPGKMTYIDGRLNTPGIHYYVGYMSINQGIMQPDEIGEIKFKFNETDIYEGQGLFDSQKNEWLRIGLGKETWGGQEERGGGYDSFEDGLYEGKKVFLDMYLGSYDSKNHDWMYGNGVWCYKYDDGTPACFIKGFWEGEKFIKNWDGDFSRNLNVPDKYLNAPEKELDMEEIL